MTKALPKAIMERTRLKNKFKKNPTNQNRLLYKANKFLFITYEKKEEKIFCKPK